MTPEKEQRVNIQYSIKVSELPELLDEMLAAAEKKLCSVVSEFKQHNINNKNNNNNNKNGNGEEGGGGGDRRDDENSIEE